MNDEVQDLKQEISSFLLAAVDHSADKPRPARRRKRRRGGQPGNQNARKHGLYALNLPPEDREVLHEARRKEYLAAEIDAVRVEIARLLDGPERDLKLALRAMETLRRLVRTDDQIRAGP